MFDVRPVNETGDLDWEKIEKIENILTIESEEIKNALNEKIVISNEFYEKRNKIRQEDFFENAEIYQLGEKFRSNEIPIFHKSDFIPRRETTAIETEQPGLPEARIFREEEFEETEYNKNDSRKIKEDFRFSDLFFPARFTLNFSPRKTAFYFGISSLIVALTIGGFAFGSRGLKIKGEVLGTSQEAYSSLDSAINSLKDQNYEASGLEFEKSYEKFSEASKNLDEVGKVFIEISRFFPVSSQLSSGKNLIEAGKHVSLAGQSFNKIVAATSSLKNPLKESDNTSVSLLDIFQLSEKEIKTANQELESAQENIKNVNVDDLPKDKQQEFIDLKGKLPMVIQSTSGFLKNSEIFADLLGENGPRKYLFLFQNNQEMRATGGFIGSYGLLDISDGRVRNFFVDGIFNPDGQLQDKIIPPEPIQKISAAWSLHDSNWFPDFPASAKEAILFYEKTGGPTADGVIALTPTIMQKLLSVTGPIEMKDYGVTIDSDNFIEKTQQEVEADYDKEHNQPKKILSDLAPIILDKIFNARDPKSVLSTLDVLSSGLEEKHILLYSQDENIQKIISGQGWSGETLKTPKDYLSVINSNINGYKTDGVIDEEISHNAEIQPDGGIVDTVTVSRHHNGGNFSYVWWNKVNADYMRVYVPLGSKLISAEGQTRETDKPPLDYEALGFRKDPLVQKEEAGISIDENSGTKIFEEAGKTVFANWTYVSPQETMTIQYKYLLPFKITFDTNDKPADSYSLLAQKQSGSLGSKLSSKITFPKNYNAVWNYPENLDKKGNEASMETDLKTDQFIGLVFTKEGILND
jgi:hypothetical protein